MQLTFLVTSPRVAPGLMSWAAWSAVSAADEVLASDGGSPLARAVAAAGHRVGVLPDPAVTDLLGRAARSGRLVWLATDEEATRFPSTLAQAVVAAAEAGRALPQVEVLHGAYDVPGARLLDLVAVMDRLRTSCPWDKEQTHRSLARYLLEESHETLEAIETGDLAHLREELGDLLLQVVFHARIASEDTSEPFDIDDVAAHIVDKLVRRHPHVFAGDPDADTVSRSDVEASWEVLKAAEKRRTSVLEGIPQSLPALALAEKVLGRAAEAGVRPEPGEDDLGDRLLALVLEARARDADPEQALRDAVRRVAAAVRDVEGAAG